MPERPPNLLIRWTAPAVLLVLAGIYSVLVFQYDYNLWEGPNFGMFASAEGPETRLVRCIVLDEEEEHPVDCPAALGRGLLRVKSVPTERNIHRLGESFARIVSVRDLGPPSASSIRVELWQFRYDAEGSRAVFEERLSADFELAGDDT